MWHVVCRSKKVHVLPRNQFRARLLTSHRHLVLVGRTCRAKHVTTRRLKGLSLAVIRCNGDVSSQRTPKKREGHK